MEATLSSLIGYNQALSLPLRIEWARQQICYPPRKILESPDSSGLQEAKARRKFQRSVHRAYDQRGRKVDEETRYPRRNRRWLVHDVYSVAFNELLHSTSLPPLRGKHLSVI